MTTGQIEKFQPDYRALIKARHGSSSRSMEMTADASYPKTEISLLMQSPCRPEENGYFGATYGIPSKVFYEFDFEARKSVDVNQALMILQEHIVDVVLSVTFPTICSYEGDGRPPAKKTQEVEVRGFKFELNELEIKQTCKPQKDQSNYCERFAGKVYVFGGDFDDTVTYTRSAVGFAIGSSVSHLIGHGVERVETVQIHGKDLNVDLENEEMELFSLPVICGLIGSGVCIILGLVILLIYMKRDKVRHKKLLQAQRATLSKRSTTGNTSSASYRYLSAKGQNLEDTTDNESFSSEISSVQIDFEKGGISKLPSDKIHVQFDPEYASSCDVFSERSSGSPASSSSNSTSSSSRTSSRALSRGPSATMSHPPHYLDPDGRYSPG